MFIDIILIVLIATIGVSILMKSNKSNGTPYKHNQQSTTEVNGEGIYKILNMSWEYKGV